MVKQNEKYLKYPKLYLQTNKPKCDSKNCAQCQSTKGTLNYNICSFKRKEIANELFSQAQQRLFLSDELRRVIVELCMSDKTLIARSTKYILNKNWFVGVYSYLSWQKEMVGILLHNLAYFNSNSNNEKIISCKFELLTLVHSYLEQVIEYLVLLFSCFDIKHWLPIFYPFICTAIGDKQCGMLFASIKNVLNDVDTTCGVGIVALETATAIDNTDDTTFVQMDSQKQLILCTMKALASFKRLIICNSGDNDDLDAEFDDNSKINDCDRDMIGSNLNSHCRSHVFNMANTIYSKLQEMILNIKTKLAIGEIGGTGQNNNSSDDEESDKKDNNEDVDDNTDWKGDFNINVKKAEMHAKHAVPSFIELFIIHRVFKNHVWYNIKIDNNNIKVQVSRLVCDAFKDKKIQKVANFMLTSLLTHGIKNFMSQFYNEEKHSNIIQMIFNEIILKQFEKEYSAVIHETNGKDAKNMNSNHVYPKMVFNLKDLMCLIFEYLAWNVEFACNNVGWTIDACSLVSSNWLYYRWNFSQYIIATSLD